MRNLWIICGAALAVLHAAAQTPAATPQPPPQPPFITTKLPGWCQWTVDYTYPPGKPAAARIVNLSVVRTGDVWHEVRSLEDGSKNESWKVGGALVEQNPASGKLIVRMEEGASVTDFTEFNWISTANFKTRKNIAGVDCLVFEERLNPLQVFHPEFGTTHQLLSPDGQEEGLVNCVAVVTDDGRLPVALQMPSESMRYTFLSPPLQKLTPPPAYASAIKAVRDQVEAATRPPSPP